MSNSPIASQQLVLLFKVFPREPQNNSLREPMPCEDVESDVEESEDEDYFPISQESSSDDEDVMESDECETDEDEEGDYDSSTDEELTEDDEDYFPSEDDVFL